MISLLECVDFMKDLVYTMLQLRQVIFFVFIDLIGAIHKKHTKRPHCEQRSLKTPVISLLQRSQCHGTIFISSCAPKNYITLKRSWLQEALYIQSDKV